MHLLPVDKRTGTHVTRPFIRTPFAFLPYAGILFLTIRSFIHSVDWTSILCAITSRCGRRVLRSCSVAEHKTPRHWHIHAIYQYSARPPIRWTNRYMVVLYSTSIWGWRWKQKRKQTKTRVEAEKIATGVVEWAKDRRLIATQRKYWNSDRFFHIWKR